MRSSGTQRAWLGMICCDSNINYLNLTMLNTAAHKEPLATTSWSGWALVTSRARRWRTRSASCQSTSGTTPLLTPLPSPRTTSPTVCSACSTEASSPGTSTSHPPSREATPLSCSVNLRCFKSPPKSSRLPEKLSLPTPSSTISLLPPSLSWTMETQAPRS